MTMHPIEQAKVARQWWSELQPDPEKKRPGDRGALARLRRCATPLQAATEPVALDLARRVGVRDGADPHLADVLATAIVLAHVRADDASAAAARRLGAGGPDKPAPMSPLRLTRLLAAETADERIIAFRRAVALAGYCINVGDLALALLDWSDRIRTRWAFAYHDTPPPTVSIDSNIAD